MSPSQPPRKNAPKADLDFFTNPDDPSLFPPAQHISGEHVVPEMGPIQPDKTRVLLSLRDIVTIVVALVSVISTYFIFKYSVAEANDKAGTAVNRSAEAITAAQAVERRVNRHDTDLAVVEKKVEAFKEDLDRRFADVKDSQKESEKRILDAVRDLRQEVRRK